MTTPTVHLIGSPPWAARTFAHIEGACFVGALTISGRNMFVQCNFDGRVVTLDAESQFHLCNFDSEYNSIHRACLGGDADWHNRLAGNTEPPL